MLQSVLFLTFVFLSLPVCIFGQSSDWVSECVDCPKQFEQMTDRNLRYDSLGHPHVAYGGDHLYYAYHDGSTWYFDLVDGSEYVGSYASIALDTGDRPHISYYDEANGDLKYAVLVDTAWQIETVDSEGDVGSSTSIALDSGDYPCISYSDNSAGNLKYAYKNPSGWTHEIIDSYAASYSSLVLDSEERPHISYKSNYSYGSLRYACLRESGWSIETIHYGEYYYNSYGYYSSIALACNGQPRIAYARRGYDPEHTPFNLWYAWRDSTDWHTEHVTSLGNQPPLGHSSIALDSMDTPYITFAYGVYSYPPYHSTCLAHKGVSGWSVETIISEPCYDTSLALNMDSEVTFAFRTSYDLHYAVFDQSVWEIVVLDSSGSVGTYASHETDTGDRLHIAYYDDANKNLKYALKDASGWENYTVDAGDDVGKYTSLAVDQNGFPHISYYSDAYPEEGLRYAHEDMSGWYVESIEYEGTGSFGYWGTSIAVDDEGVPHISARETNEGFMYVSRGESGWIIELVESGWAGNYSSLRLDGDGFPHISYYKSANHLHYAYRDLLGWNIETVDNDGNVGTYTSLELDTEGRPHISYHDETNSDLKYAYKGNSGWEIEVVDDSGIVGRYTSLALDAQDRPCISYHDLTADELKYASKDDDDHWHFQTVEDGLTTGSFTSLGITPDGTPHICYYYHPLTSLKHAYLSVAVDMELTWSLVGDDLQLSWLPLSGTTSYWIYGDANNPHFTPGFAPQYENRLDALPPGTTTWISPYPVGDPVENWTYLILAVDGIETELARSNRVGEFDWGIDVP